MALCEQHPLELCNMVAQLSHNLLESRTGLFSTSGLPGAKLPHGPGVDPLLSSLVSEMRTPASGQTRRPTRGCPGPAPFQGVAHSWHSLP